MHSEIKNNARKRNMKKNLAIASLLVILLILFNSCAGTAPAATPAAPAASPVRPSANQSQSGTSPATKASVPSISLQDASVLVQNNKNNPEFIILDVRTADEFNSGHLAGAVNIDYYSPDFKANIDKLERKKEYFIYCRTGVRSAEATRIMLDLGFTRVHNLLGGITEWINAGYPVVK
jgi:rhodanese-related sulfurtransferase